LKVTRFRGTIDSVEQQAQSYQAERLAGRDAPRVGLNAHLLSLDSTYRSAGVSRYIHNLMRCLPTADAALRYEAFTSVRGGAYPGWLLHLSHLPTHRPLARMLWEQLCGPVCTRKLDLLHSPVYVSPLLAPCPTVVTIHDLSFIKLPGTFRAGNRSYLRLFTRLSAQKAEKVIVVSENTKRDAALLLGIPLERMVVIPNGVDAAFRRVQDRALVAEFRRRRGLPSKFLLYVGTIEPRKNLTTLIRAFARLKERGNVDHALVIGGSKGWMYEPVLGLAQDLGLSREILFPGFLSPEELPLWYNAADVFAYPSLYEGFGLPPLEAMACGTPVIASNASALPEVVGVAGVLVDPLDIEAWVAAMEELLLNPALRRSLGDAGLQRARRFTWQHSAQMTAQLYREIIADRTPHYV